MTDEELLLSCPFCEEEGELTYDSHYNSYHVECCWCGIEGRSFCVRDHTNARLEAINSWNTRPQSDKTDQYKKGFMDCKALFDELLSKLKPELTEPE
jgi:Restriction alleviation protein Lar